MGYGRADSRDGAVFQWNFPLLGTYWTAADVAIQHIAKEMGGFDKLKGKKIALLYHDSPYGKEPIAALEVMAKKYGFELPARSRCRRRAASRSRSGCRSASRSRTMSCCGAGAS